MDATAFAEFVADLDERTSAVPPDIPFSREEYAGRLSRLRAAMAEDGIDTLLLSSPEAMNWLHGLSLRWYKAQAPRMWRPLTCTAVHVDHDRFIQFEGIEHAEMLRRTSVAEDIRLLPRYRRDDMLGFIVGQLAGEGWLAGTVGVEKYSHIPNAAVAALIQEAMESHGATVVDGTDAARRVRRCKSPAEITYVEKAAEICDTGLQHLGQVLRPGMTELEAWAEMTSAMAQAGGSRPRCTTPRWSAASGSATRSPGAGSCTRATSLRSTRVACITTTTRTGTWSISSVSHRRPRWR